MTSEAVVAPRQLPDLHVPDVLETALRVRVRDVDLRRRRLALNENAVRVGSAIHVGTPNSHERRSVPYPEFLDAAVTELCEEKSRQQLLFGDET